MKYYIKPLLFILPIIFVTTYYLVTLSNRSEFAHLEAAETKAIPDYDTLKIEELQDWKGNSIKPSTSVEPIIIVHFWASWCGPCIHEFPDLINMSKAMRGKVKVFALSEDKQSEEIKAFIKSFKDAETTDNFHIVWDQDHQIMNKWEVSKLPESYIFGPDRKLAKRISGAVAWMSQDTKDYFQILLRSPQAEQNQNSIQPAEAEKK